MGLLGLFGKKRQSLIASGLLQGISDCHTHILPGVDDGSAALEQSLEILEYQESLGVRAVWCTPHIMEDVPNATAYLKDRFGQLCDAYAGNIELHLAAEYMLDLEFEQRMEASDILVHSEDMVLVETSTAVPPYDLEGMLQRIMSKGYRPLLAHPERYRYMEMPDYERLYASGVRYQLNLGALTGYYGETAMEKAQQLLGDGLYVVAGSDCHRLGSIRYQFESEELSAEVIGNLTGLLEKP